MAEALLSEVEGATGHMVLARDGGALVESSGSLEGCEDQAAAVYRTLQDANVLIQASTGALMTAMTVAFSDRTLTVALDDSRVYVVAGPGSGGAGGKEEEE